MKTTYSLLFSVVLLCGAGKGFSQQASDPTKIVGHFEIDTTVGSVMNHINVNYELSPVPFGSTAHIVLNTAEQRLLNMDLIGPSGAVISSSAPGAAGYFFTHDFNISSLPAGTYQIAIRKYNTAAVLHTINFTK